MHPSLFLAALCLGIASAAPQQDHSLDAHWSQWKEAHGKLYDKVGNIRAVQRDPQRTVYAAESSQQRVAS